MSYATITDLQDRIGQVRLVQLTDLERPSTGAVGEVVAQTALDDASAEIDGYLMGRYSVPVTTLSALPALRGYCVTLAHYRLLGDAASEVLQADVKALRSLLMAISRGDMPLMPPSDVPAPSGAGEVLFAPTVKVMGRDAY